MTRYVRRRSTAKVGLSPGSVVFTGERKAEHTRLTLFSYDVNHVEEVEIDDPSVLPGLLARPGKHWLNVDGVHDAALVETIGSLVDAHSLALEDIVSPGQRPKIEDFEENAFIVTREFTYDRAARRIESEQISFLLSARILISFQERPGDVFGPVRARLRSGKGRMRGLGPDYLAYALLDVIVDNYFVVLEALGDELDEVEEVVIEAHSFDVQRRLRALRSNLVHIRRACWPVRDVLASIMRDESTWFSPDVRLFVRDAHDHAVQVAEVVESLREVVFGLSDLLMGSLSQRMNEIMKVLTVISTIFMPLSFIAGVYGMNFDHMPELHWTHGYLFALSIMAVTAGGLLMFFRKREWL